MNQERFTYLLEGYKADLLSEPELGEWLQVAVDESFHSIVDRDLQYCMTHPVKDMRWSATLEAAAWRNIKDARSGHLRCLSR